MKVATYAELEFKKVRHNFPHFVKQFLCRVSCAGEVGVSSVEGSGVVSPIYRVFTPRSRVSEKNSSHPPRLLVIYLHFQSSGNLMVQR